MPRGESPPASMAAVVAIVCGVLLCLGPLTAVPAIIAGLMARHQAHEQPTKVGGANMALAGILLGALNLVISTIGAVLLVLGAL